jgi:hypothetical protein
MNAATEAMSSKETSSYNTFRVFIVCLPPDSSHTKQALDKAFIGPPKILYCLFPCEMTIFSPHDFPLASGNIYAAPVNHSALVKTSDQPSFNSSNFLPFTSADAHRLSDISPVPSLN